jgi:proline dehydrogenase
VTILNRSLVRLLPAVPRPIVQRISSRYIAGETCADALRAVRDLNAAGKAATIDVLGEEIHNETEARAIADEYRDVLDQIDRAGLDSTISVKLTGLGLALDYGLCRENLLDVVRHAAERSNVVTIDMEDSSTTDDTLDLYRELRSEGHDNLGIVLQAALRRTVDDAEAVGDLRPEVRLCKGIYIEPASIAYRDDDAVRASFVAALERLLDARCYVGVATHDDWLIAEAERLIRARGYARDDYEFQMLLGVRPELGERLVHDGHRLRVYVPFGRDWYEYSLRRLQENPKIAGYVAGDALGRFVPGRRDRAAASA